MIFSVRPTRFRLGPLARALPAVALAALMAAAPGSGAVAAEDRAGPYLAARVAMAQNDFAAAVGFLDRLLTQEAPGPMLLESAAAAHLALGDLDRAAVYAAELDAQGLTTQAGRMATIGAQLVAGAHAEVLEELRSGNGLGQLIDPLLRAWLQVSLGSMSEAVAEFDALAAGGGMEVFGRYHHALALAHVGDFEGAEELLGGAEGAAPLRLTRRGSIARAQILSQLDRPDEAQALLSEVFGGEPDPEIAALRAGLEDGEPVPFDVVTSPRDGMAEVFFDVASTLQGEAENTLTLLFSRLAEALRPDHVPARLLTAGLLSALDQQALAVEAYAAVPATAPQAHLAELGRAEALSRAGDPEAARAVLEALAETHPDLAIVHITLGDLLRRERQFDAASHAYDRAIDLLGTPRPQHWVVWYTRAITHEREDRWEQAEADFRKALELNPEQPHVLNYLGYSLVERREDLDEALEMIRRAVEGEPDNGYIVDSLGWVYYRLGRYEEALEHMERAVELLPTDPILNDHLGDVYYALGRSREARFQWRRALSFGPADDLDMDRIRRKLEVGLDAVLIEEGAEPHHRTAESSGHGN